MAENLEEWLGTTMFFSHHDAKTNREMIWNAGFELEYDEVIAEDEHGEPVPFLWVIGRKPKKGGLLSTQPAGTKAEIR